MALFEDRVGRIPSEPVPIAVTEVRASNTQADRGGKFVGWLVGVLVIASLAVAGLIVWVLATGRLHF